MQLSYSPCDYLLLMLVLSPMLMPRVNSSGVLSLGQSEYKDTPEEMASPSASDQQQVPTQGFEQDARQGSGSVDLALDEMLGEAAAEPASSGDKVTCPGFH